MKVKVIKRAYYDLEYLKEGAIIDYKGKELPSWAVPVKENKKQQETKTSDNVGQKEVNEDKKPVNTDDEKKTPLDNVGQKEGEATPQDLEYLDSLINKGIEKGILIDDADKKTVKEQIKELEELLKEELL